MTLEEFQVSIELEKEWREDDIRFYHNLQSRLEGNDSLRLRCSIICMFYAHIEGFVYDSFSLYVESINNLSLKCKDVKPVIAAASLHKEFSALKDPERKNSIFRKSLPDDTKLHRFCRQVDFIESSLLIQDKIVKIPKQYINTESNVGPDVLKKLLYQLGLDYNDSALINDDLHELLKARNNIAHGKYKTKDGIANKDYEKYKDCFYQTFSKLSNVIVRAYANKDYLSA